VRVKATADSAPVDLAAFRSAIDRLATRWRELRVSETGTERNGVVNRGLRVESGVHPWPGVRYRVVEADERAWLVELRADEADRVEFRVHDVDGTQTADVTVRHPTRVDAVEVAWGMQSVGAGWWTRGRLTVELRADFTQSRPSLEVKLRHRHVRARCSIEVDASRPTRWTTSLDATIRGNGVLRPFGGLFTPIVRVLIARQLRKSVREFPAKVDEFNERVAARFGTPPSPDRIAEVVLEDFFSELVDAP
jgi:hypothetical protein